MTRRQVKQTLFKKKDGKIPFLQKISEENVIEFFKKISFIVLPVLLVWVSVSFFTTAADSFQAKLTIGALNAIPEITALALLYMVLKLWRNPDMRRIFKIAYSVGLLTLYFFLNIQSYVARVGYVLSEAQKNAVVLEAKNSTFDQLGAKVRSLDLDISTLYSKWSNATTLFTNKNDVDWYRTGISAQIKEKTDKRGTYTSKRGTQQVDTVMSSYVAIAHLLWNMNPLVLFTFTTSARMFSLDLCAIIIIFSSTKKRKVQVSEVTKTISASIEVTEKSQLEKYIEALFIDEGRFRKLPPDYQIAQKTRIPLPVCEKYRKALRFEMSIGTKPILERSGTYTVANYSKIQILNHIRASAQKDS
jgi:hypothetical protein